MECPAGTNERAGGAGGKVLCDEDVEFVWEILNSYHGEEGRKVGDVGKVKCE